MPDRRRGPAGGDDLVQSQCRLAAPPTCASRRATAIAYGIDGRTGRRRPVCRPDHPHSAPGTSAAPPNEDRDFYPIINSADSIAWNTSKLDYVQYARSVVLKSEMLYAQDEIRAFSAIGLKVDVGATWYNLTYSAKSPLEYNAPC